MTKRSSDGCGRTFAVRVVEPVHPGQKESTTPIACGEDGGTGVRYFCADCAVSAKLLSRGPGWS